MVFLKSVAPVHFNDRELHDLLDTIHTLCELEGDLFTVTVERDETGFGIVFTYYRESVAVCRLHFGIGYRWVLEAGSERLWVEDLPDYLHRHIEAAQRRYGGRFMGTGINERFVVACPTVILKNGEVPKAAEGGPIVLVDGTDYQNEWGFFN